MKVKILVGLMVFTVLGVCTTAFAEPLDFSNSKWEASAAMGTAISVQEDSASNLFHITGRLTYDVTPRIAVGVTSGWIGFGVDVQGEDWGDATSIPLLATLIYRFPLESTENRVVPYVVGGLGAMFWSLDSSSYRTDNGITVEDDTSFVAQLGVGVDYFFNDRFAAFGEISFVTNKLETTYDIEGVSADNKFVGENDSVFLGAGVKARF